AGRDFAIMLLTSERFLTLFEVAYRGADNHRTLQSASDIFELFDDLLERDATDLHLKIGEPARIRVDGRLTSLPYAPVDGSWMDRNVRRIAGDERWAKVKATFDADLAYSYGDRRFRVNLGMDANGVTLAARLLAEHIP